MKADLTFSFKHIVHKSEPLSAQNLLSCINYLMYWDFKSKSWIHSLITFNEWMP